jgi:DNA-binding transcriptional LysR family regulator
MAISQTNIRAGKGRDSDFRLPDIEAFLEVMRVGSVNGAARALRIGASQVSKSVARLERYVHLTLLARSTRGVQLTDDGRRLAPKLVDLLARARQLDAPLERSELIVAAPSFLWSALVARLGPLLRDVRVYAFETRSSTMPAFAGQSFFDAAFTVGNERWPASWVKTEVGTIRRALYGTPAKARQLGPSVKREVLRREVFVGRIDSDRGQLLPTQDGCPLSDRERRFGHRAQTVAMALEMARMSGELVFAPAIGAQRYLARGSLVEIAVDGWDVREPLYVVCHQDRVEARLQRALIEGARTMFARAR